MSPSEITEKVNKRYGVVKLFTECDEIQHFKCRITHLTILITIHTVYASQIHIHIKKVPVEGLYPKRRTKSLMYFCTAAINQLGHFDTIYHQCYAVYLILHIKILLCKFLSFWHTRSILIQTLYLS